MTTHRSPRRFRPVFAALSVTLVLGAAACSASGDDAGDTPPTDDNGQVVDRPETDTDGTDGTDSADRKGPSVDTTDDVTDDTTDDVTDGLNGMSRDEIVTEIADGIIASDGIPNLDQATAECVAGDLVDIVGLEELARIGVSPDAFSGIDEADAEEFARSWGDCGYDLEGFLLQTLRQQGATDEQAQCVYDAVGNETIEELLAIGFSGADGSERAAEVQADVRTAIAGCR